MKVEVGQIWKIKNTKSRLGLWKKIIIKQVENTDFSYANFYNKKEFTGITAQFSNFSQCYELIKSNPKINWILYGS